MVKKQRSYGVTKSGSGYCVTQYARSEILLFEVSGKAAGAARYVPHVRRYAWNGEEYKSRAALLRAFCEVH